MSFMVAAGGVTMFISFIGLVFYIFVIVTVFTRKKFEQNSFFRIAGSLGIADCICLLLMVGYASPCMLLQRNISESRIFGAILNIGWFSGLPLILLLAGDRYLCICKHDAFTKYYNIKQTNLYCIACWVFGIGYSIPSLFSCCGIHFDYHIASWQWNVKKPGASILGYGEITMVILITTLTFLLNGLVLK